MMMEPIGSKAEHREHEQLVGFHVADTGSMHALVPEHHCRPLIVLKQWPPTTAGGKHNAAVDRLRRQLEPMNVKQLKERALKDGFSAEIVEAVDAEHDPKGAIIRVLMNALGSGGSKAANGNPRKTLKEAGQMVRLQCGL